MKAVSKSISFPQDTLAAAMAHCASIGQKLSTYVVGQLEADLTGRGLLKGGAVAAEVARMKELVAVHGLDVVKAKLDELAEASIAHEAAAGGGK